MSKLNAERESLLGGAFETGVLVERGRIIKVLEKMMDDYQPMSEEFDVLADAVAIIEQGSDEP